MSLQLTTFKSPSDTQSAKLEELKIAYSNLNDSQKQSGFHFPIVFTGKSGSGKDILLDGSIELLSNTLGFNIGKTRSRYLSRTQRPGEEDSGISFVSKEEFQRLEQNNTFGHSYYFDGKHYGLEKGFFIEELSQKNIAIVNGSIESIESLIEFLIGLDRSYAHVGAPLLFQRVMDTQRNIENLLERPGSELERRNRIGKVRSEPSTTIHDMFPNYSPLIQIIQGLPIPENPEQNQLNFNDNILEVAGGILSHINANINKKISE